MAATNRIAIIGTADRNKELVMDDFERMKTTAIAAIETLGFTLADAVLVSGGAPWADHVAVSLFLDGKVAGLHLHLPGKLEVDKQTIQIKPLNDSRAANCLTISSYHHRFKKITGLDSLAQIQQAIDQGATVEQHAGYFKRNDAIARDCTALVALHTIRKHPSKQSNGGTVYTFNKASVPKLYIPFRDTRRSVTGYAKLGFNDFEMIGIQAVFRSVRCFKGPLNKFFKRRAEDECDAGPSKRRKSLPPCPL